MADDLEGGDKSSTRPAGLTSEMDIKSAQMGIPIVVSRSGVTQMGHEVARSSDWRCSAARQIATFSLLRQRPFRCASRAGATRRGCRHREADFAGRRYRHRPTPAGPPTSAEAEPLRRFCQVEQGRRAEAALDLVEQRSVPAQREHRLGDDEHRADKQADTSSTNAGFLPSYQCPTTG